jgi:DNA polymerase III sliding clamp (beta) subunit (PCNA family)
MEITQDDIDEYDKLHESNKKLIIKKNTLNHLLKGPQSSAIIAVLDKVASNNIDGVTDDHVSFVKMLQLNNYDINKIIDDHVKNISMKVNQPDTPASTESSPTPTAERTPWTNPRARSLLPPADTPSK